jgi:hypothetical protein
MTIYEKIATVLGWTVDECRTFSLPTLRELVRGTGAEKDITAIMNGSEYLTDETRQVDDATFNDTPQDKQNDEPDTNVALKRALKRFKR